MVEAMASRVEATPNPGDPGLSYMTTWPCMTRERSFQCSGILQTLKNQVVEVYRNPLKSQDFRKSHFLLLQVV